MLYNLIPTLADIVPILIGGVLGMFLIWINS